MAATQYVLYLREDYEQERNIKLDQLASEGILGYVAEVVADRHIDTLKRSQRRKPSIPLGEIVIPVEGVSVPIVDLYGFSGDERVVCEQILQGVSISRIRCISRSRVYRAVINVRATLKMSGVVIHTNGSSSGSGAKSSSGDPGIDEMNDDL